jgi:hypothetical protein
MILLFLCFVSLLKYLTAEEHLLIFKFFLNNYSETSKNPLGVSPLRKGSINAIRSSD